MGYRPARLAEELKNEIGAIISREIRDPRVGFVTVTSVEVSQDLRHAKIFISIFGAAEEKAEAFKALKNATGYIRKLIASRIKLRTVPELSFGYDESIETGDRMMRLFEDIKSDSKEFNEEEDNKETA